MPSKAIVFNIQRFCVHDGPGIRTTVFLKGCNLYCPWCHNPESINPAPEPMFYIDRCRQCLSCMKSCPAGALKFEGGRISRRQEDCMRCFACAAACPCEAMVKSGGEMSVEEVYTEVIRDRPFYETSGGGATISGGEPMLYPEFLKKLFARLKEAGISTCIETAGNLQWKNFETIMPLADMFIYDIKSGDAQKLRDLTGASLKLVTGNLEKLLGNGKKIFIRIPVIPGFNADIAGMEKLKNILNNLPPGFTVELLRYNSLADGKYCALNTKNPFKRITDEQAKKTFEAAKDFFEKAGFMAA